MREEVITPKETIELPSAELQEEVEKIIGNLYQTGKIVFIDKQPDHSKPSPDEWMISHSNWEQFVHRSVDILRTFHSQNPLRMGMPREELKSRLQLHTRVFNVLFAKLKSDQLVTDVGGLVKLPDHQIIFSPIQQKQINRLMETFAATPLATPSVKETQKIIGDDVYFALLELNQLIQDSPDVVFRTADFEIIQKQIVTKIAEHGTITVAEMRDQFQSSRKYALAILEYLDAKGITMREGDFRRLGSNSRLIKSEEKNIMPLRDLQRTFSSAVVWAIS